MNGLQHFEQFQAALGIARNILSDRLAKMVDGGILERAADPGDRRKVVYSLTAKGEALLPVVLALRQWGEDWGHGSQDIVLADRATASRSGGSASWPRTAASSSSSDTDVDRPRDGARSAPTANEKGGRLTAL